MGLSNLPPGCSVNDIPGNRPEDMEYEAFWEALEDRCRELNIAAPDPDDEQLSRWLELACELGYNQGFGEGKDEGIMSMQPDEEVET